MHPILMHAQIQMWSAKAGMSKSRTVCIESSVGKREAKLLLYFSTGKIKALQLNKNIKSVILRTYGEDQNYVHLTFKNNDFLFVEKLTTTNAKQLKKFLDKVYQRNLQESSRNDEETSGGPSTSREELSGSSSLEVHSEAGSKCLESAEECEATMLCEGEVPSSSSSSATLNSIGLLEKQLVKRKRSSPDSGKKQKGNILKGSSKGFEAKSVVPVHHDEGKGRDVREAEKSKPGFGFSSETNYPEESDADVREFRDLITKLFSPFLLEPHRLEKGVEWHEYMKTLLLYPEKAWQGLPNVGNTCYINVVLQSLCSVPLFVNDLFNQGFPWIKHPRDDFNMCLMQLLVLKDIYNMKTREKLLISITKSLPELGEVFIVDTQNDAHEFLSLCLVQLKETVQKLSVLWQSENESGGNSLLRRIFGDHAIINKIPVCPVASNFEFELMRSIFCKGCGQAIFKKEQSSYLSINIPQGLKGQNLSIQSSFDLFFKAEELEHRCEKCLHNKSIALHKFGSLPRVIIIHLKRYRFSLPQVTKKDDQHIVISLYLKLSFHCNKNTRPPNPISQNAHVKDLDLLKPLQELDSDILKLPFDSMMTSRFKDSTVSTRSGKESEAQNAKRMYKVLSGKVQQKDQGKYATRNAIGSELTNETEKLKKHEKANLRSKLDPGSVSEATEDNDIRIPERSQKCQAQKCSSEQISRKAVAKSHPKACCHEQKENPRKPAHSHTQNGNLNSQGSLYSSRSSRNKDGLGKKAKPTGKVESHRVTGKEENAYRLINIISHIGSSPHGGHYINDAYDFRKQDWFTYSDPQVTRIQEDFVCKARLSTGYVFFYMHNDIFEELLARETRSRNTSQK